MNITELNQIAETVRQKKSEFKKCVYVCTGAGCISSGSLETLDAMKKAVKESGHEKDADIRPAGCMGPCVQGPLVKIIPEDKMYQKVVPENVKTILDKSLLADEVISSLLLFSEKGEGGFSKAADNPYYRKQNKIVLENCGSINPESIEDYISIGGYSALYKVLTSMSSEDVISEIKESGIRGRGGAGYPTAMKWKFVHDHASAEKYVICNGDEGDPGAFMDRSVLEGDPHRVIEGLAIAGYAMGAKQGYLYVRAEYPLAIKRFDTAIKQARKLGLLGEKIFETDFSFNVDIRVGAGAFVCGEETALMASIEGKRGVPSPRPPYPAESGLWGKPTAINNVETLANIAPIIQRGGKWFSAIGSRKSTGTKVFALTGTVNHTGLIEVPMGMTMREIIFDIGGGIPGGKKFKAAQTGGPSGGCIPEQYLDTPVDYDSLTGLGSIMGSGGLIVMDETSCMVDVARFFMEFCMDESCGKCVPCRVGTKHMYDFLTRICEGEAAMSDLEQLKQLAPFVRDTSLCGLGVTAPNPLLSTLRYFHDEYIAHITQKRCPAGVCKMTSGVGHVH
ncbi:MAG: NAD(P)H-dependent oxidoreductase subunit E [Candidatus Omnitrophica bacterium]|nr:NAD(P)H-dependent oxidoreductase subunit E [Candidatus Omnitrophota bacterium]